MPSYSKGIIAALAVAATLCSAQTSTTCNPMDKTCPADPGLSNSTYDVDFTQGSSSFDHWNTTAGTVTSGPQGAEFTIHKRFDAPTIETDFYFFFGSAEVKMMAANGTGIVSSIVLISDDLDEIDWEALGGDTANIETNYFGKGNTTTYNRAAYEAVTDPQSTLHTYTINWTSSSIEWSIDGNVVRTLGYADAGNDFPQTPMRLKLGIWAGGDPSNPPGTIEWAGGETNYADAPFTMYVKSVKITNLNPAESYRWSDRSGSFESIKASNSSEPSLSAMQSTANASSTANSAAKSSGVPAVAKSAKATGGSAAPNTAGRSTLGLCVVAALASNLCL